MAVVLCSTILVSQPNEGECTSLLPSCLPCNIDCTSNAPGHGAGLDIRFGPWNLWHLQQRPFRSSLRGPVFHRSIAGYIFLAIIIKRGSGFTLILYHTSKPHWWLLCMCLCMNAGDTSLTYDGQMFCNHRLCLQGKNEALFPPDC